MGFITYIHVVHIVQCIMGEYTNHVTLAQSRHFSSMLMILVFIIHIFVSMSFNDLDVR
jgi:hypothetical protein